VLADELAADRLPSVRAIRASFMSGTASAARTGAPGDPAHQIAGTGAAQKRASENNLGVRREV
jgi:hypothetical protein